MPFRAILSLVLVSTAASFAQSENPDYDVLAKQAILDYTITKRLDGWVDKADFEANVSALYELVSSKKYEYQIIKLWQYRSYEAVALVDETNFQLHGLNTTLYYVDKTSARHRYLRLDVDRMEDLISKYILPEWKQDNSARTALIDLYNSTAFFFENTYYKSFTMIRSENDSAFYPMRPFLKLSDIHHFYQDGLKTYQPRAYMMTFNSGLVEFWRIIYFFDPVSFRTEKELVLRYFTDK